MPNLGAPELIIIAIVLIALFGWKKLPDMARSLGRSARVFKSEVDELKKDGKSSEASRTTVPGEAVDADAERRAAEARLAEAERRAAEARAEADRLRAASGGGTTSPAGGAGAASTPDATSDVRRDTTL
jgi:sec-independent protein translocase protein TatA